MRKGLFWSGVVLLMLLGMFRFAVNFGPLILIDMIATRHWLSFNAFQAAFGTIAEMVQQKHGLSPQTVYGLYAYHFTSDIALLTAAVLLAWRKSYSFTLAQSFLGINLAVALFAGILLGIPQLMRWIPLYLPVMLLLALPGVRAYLHSSAGPEAAT